jgi:hypothetical protein
MKKIWVGLAGGLLLGMAAPAMAADLGVAVAAPAPAKPSPTTTIGIEIDPEFLAVAKAKDPAGPAGTLSDDYLKLSLSHTIGGLWVVSGYVQAQDDIKTAGGDKFRYYAEGALGYKIKLNSFTLTPSIGIGEVWGDTGVTAANPSAAYYALYLAGDWKISPQWTWNVFNARYRNAFSFKWVTPKLSTGLTYNINSNNAVYGTVGYSWKDTGAGLKGSTINVGLGYKYSW